jgi:hypothetical protein
MIIRRRHTSNFTVIGNDLFSDERLQADEVGIMGFLLSRPNDWEIRRPALRKRWGYGREAMKRVLDNLIRTGWCRVERTRLSTGAFHVIYEIRDEAGPELSEEEVRRALSVGSTEAASDDAEDSNAPDASHPPEPCAQPPTGYPAPVDAPLASRTSPSKKEGLLNTILPNTESTQALWKSFAKMWPSAHVVSPLVCENLFAALTIENKEKAVRGVSPYLSDCRSKTRKICDLATYLRERRWESLATKSPPSFYMTRPGTPQAERWLKYWDDIKEPAKFQRYRLAHGHAISTPSEWPPALPSKSTGPPLDSLAASLDALDDFGKEMTG